LHRIQKINKQNLSIICHSFNKRLDDGQAWQCVIQTQASIISPHHLQLSMELEQKGKENGLGLS
jgi:hypothetical protein